VKVHKAQVIIIMMMMIIIITNTGVNTVQCFQLWRDRCWRPATFGIQRHVHCEWPLCVMHCCYQRGQTLFKLTNPAKELDTFLSNACSIVHDQLDYCNCWALLWYSGRPFVVNSCVAAPQHNNARLDTANWLSVWLHCCSWGGYRPTSLQSRSAQWLPFLIILQEAPG
jgi:hypothetical protein